MSHCQIHTKKNKNKGAKQSRNHQISASKYREEFEPQPFHSSSNVQQNISTEGPSYSSTSFDHLNSEHYSSHKRKRKKKNLKFNIANLKCEYCNFVNIFHIDVVEALKRSGSVIKCIYCSAVITPDRKKSKSDLENQKLDNSSKKATKMKNVPHTDCKYCLDELKNNLSEEYSNNKIKLHNTYPHTNCNYCLNDMIDNEEETASECCSIITSCAEVFDEESDLYYRHSRDEQNKNRPLHNCKSEKVRQSCYSKSHIDGEHTPMHLKNNFIDVADHFKKLTLSDLIYDKGSLYNNVYIPKIAVEETKEDMATLNNTINKKFKPCEYCFKNGESPVIYNSHQFQNRFGNITCPILKKSTCSFYDIGNDIESDQSVIYEANNAPLHIPNFDSYADYVGTAYDKPAVFKCNGSDQLFSSDIFLDAKQKSSTFSRNKLYNAYRKAGNFQQFDDYCSFMKYKTRNTHPNKVPPRMQMLNTASVHHHLPFLYNNHCYF